MLTHELVTAAIGRAMEGERLPPPALAARQREKLRALLAYAAARSPFYAELYRGIDLAGCELADLPTVSKPVVQREFDRVVSDRRLTREGVAAFCRQAGDTPAWHLGEYAVALSSGTSGERGYFVTDGPALADAIAMGFRQSNRVSRRAGRSAGASGANSTGAGAGDSGAARPPQQRIAAVMLIEPFDSAGLLMRLIPESLGPKRLIDIRGDFGSICDELTAFRPTLLSSFPYMLRMLAEAALAGRLRIAPTRITSSGDVLSASDRQAVAAAFGVAPHDYYCATEATYIAWECDQHDGLHVNADYLIVESVDAGNRPVPPGRLGERLLLTNLSNRALPLVRYEMSDQVEYADGPCPCGCLLPRIRTVAGRVEHVLRLPGAAGGRVALVPEHIDDFVGPLEGLANYQVIQQAPSRLRVNVVPATGADADAVAAAVRRGLAACFARYGVAEGVAVELCRVERLAPIRPGATKVCHYWNLCPEA